MEGCRYHEGCDSQGLWCHLIARFNATKKTWKNFMSSHLPLILCSFSTSIISNKQTNKEEPIHFWRWVWDSVAIACFFQKPTPAGRPPHWFRSLSKPGSTLILLDCLQSKPSKKPSKDSNKNQPKRKTKKLDSQLAASWISNFQSSKIDCQGNSLAPAVPPLECLCRWPGAWKKLPKMEDSKADWMNLKKKQIKILDEVGPICSKF